MWFSCSLILPVAIKWHPWRANENGSHIFDSLIRSCTRNLFWNAILLYWRNIFGIRVNVHPVYVCCITWFLWRYIFLCYKYSGVSIYDKNTLTGDPLHSRALAHSRAPLFTQPCPHCSQNHAPGEQWARLCVFTLQGCVQAAWLCRGSPVTLTKHKPIWMIQPNLNDTAVAPFTNMV